MMPYCPRFFKPVEFENCRPSCRITDMDERLLRKLDEARKICQFPFVLNSAFRTREYELSKGRKGTSSHCKGLAVDIQCSSSVVRFYMLQSLFQVGFRRIGVYPTFLHVDLDDSKVSSVWLDSNSISNG